MALVMALCTRLTHELLLPCLPSIGATTNVCVLFIMLGHIMRALLMVVTLRFKSCYLTGAFHDPMVETWKYLNSEDIVGHIFARQDDQNGRSLCRPGR